MTIGPGTLVLGIFFGPKQTLLIKRLVLVGTLPQAFFHKKVTCFIKSLVLVGTLPQFFLSQKNVFLFFDYSMCF